MSYPTCLEAHDIFGAKRQKAARKVLVQARNVIRICGVPADRRGELLAFLNTVPPIVLPTDGNALLPHLGAVWLWRDIADAMEERAPQFIPESLRSLPTVPP